jgi:AcrR family transcriptional regulator
MARNHGDLRRGILDEARGILLAEGNGQVSMRKIASAVGCTPTSIYLYFESKDALFHALIEEGMERLFEQLAAVAGEGGSPQHRFRRLCRSFLEFGLENPEYYEIMFVVHPDQVARFPSEKYRKARRNLQFFAGVLAEAHGDDDSDSMALASVVWAQLHGAVSLILSRRLDASLDTASFLDAVVAQSVRVLQSTRS